MTEYEIAIEMANRVLKLTNFGEWWETYYQVDSWLTEQTFKSEVNNMIEEHGTEVLEWIHALRMDFSNGVDFLIKDLEKFEEYELCGQLKAKQKELRMEALNLEMKLEKFLL